MCNFSLTVTFGANDFPESKLLYRLPEAAILDPGKAFPLFGEMLQPDKKKQMPTVKHIFFQHKPSLYETENTLIQSDTVYHNLHPPVDAQTKNR